MWILTLIDVLTGFIPRPIIIRPDEGGFRQIPKLWGGTWLTKMKSGNWYWLIPWVMEHEIIRIKPQVKDIRAQSVWTKDGKNMVIGGSLRYYVRDWMKAQLEVLDYDQSLQTVALATMCKYVRDHTLDDLKYKMDELSEEVLSMVKSESKGWGVWIQDFGITDVGETINLRHLVGQLSIL